MINLDKNDIEVIGMVTDLLVWYESNNEKASILQLLNFQDKLSLLSTNIAKIVGDCKASYLKAYFDRKHSFSIKKLYHIGKGSSGTKAQELAEIEIDELKHAEIEEEKASYTISLQLRQLNKVLSAVQQRLSFMKTEKQRMNALTHDNKN